MGLIIMSQQYHQKAVFTGQSHLSEQTGHKLSAGHSIRQNIIYHSKQQQPAPSLSLCCSGQGLTAASLHTL